MSDTIIKVENLSKRYRIGLQEKKADTFTQQLWNNFKAPIKNFQRIRSLGSFQDEEETVHWALKDISFEVKQGEVLGIIGKNGAGKSTLLKILSKITEPTSGRIEINGRVAALLEVGTGFHPELTGRENIYMNGTILGMTKKEIDRKLNEIIDFSGVEKYIDTPVKFYSSGMRVRLGFSVAAHLEPEILIIDEVLAVGDYEFQQKCIKKIEEIARIEGRTVIFVSHDLKVIESMCNSALLLKDGVLSEYNNANKVINNYLVKDKNRSLGFIVKSKELIDFLGIQNTDNLINLGISQNIEIHFIFKSLKFSTNNLFIDVAIKNLKGEIVVHSKAKYVTSPFSIINNEKFLVKYQVYGAFLSPGSYFLTLFLYEEYLEKEILLWVEDVPGFYINSKNPFNYGGIYLDDIKSIVCPKSDFSIVYDF